MKTLLVLTFLSASAAFAQTGLIAHKSHSGAASTFTFADPGNFGAPSPSIVSIKWINDSTVVQKMDRWGGNREDTLINHPIYGNPNIPLDSIRKMNWYDNVEYIDTNKRLYQGEAKPAKRADDKMKKVDGKKVKSASPQPKMTEDEPTKSKKNSLLWLLIIGGGTFTGMMVAGRKKKFQPAR